MKTIRMLIAEQEANQNPGQAIGKFLLGHTNNLTYLISQLEAYLEAARFDLEISKKLFHKLKKSEANPQNFRSDSAQAEDYIE